MASEPRASAAGGFGLLPQDARQAFRIRRFLIGSGTALLVIVALFVGARIGALPMQIAIGASIGVLALIALFYGLFRSGLNLRSADPSLTWEMIGVSVVFLAYIMYHAPGLRHALPAFYMVALLFGVLRLDTRTLLALAALALVAHATMLTLSFSRNHAMDVERAYVQFAVLLMVLPWFAVMGGFVNALRRRLSDSNRQLKLAYDRIELIAVHDELTGLHNRRYLMDAMAREHSRAKRLRTTFAVCLVDIDHFKRVNDKLGHAAGDAVLRHFAEIAKAGLRSVDVLGRYGGEEFLLILPDTDRAGARGAAERLRAAIEAAGFPQLPADWRVTATVGVAAHRSGESVEELVARADGALYEGKAAGRNRVLDVG